MSELSKLMGVDLYSNFGMHNGFNRCAVVQHLGEELPCLGFRFQLEMSLHHANPPGSDRDVDRLADCHVVL